ncbi:hypothetical protein X777_11155 [Ooceraea biroi]|uniref:Uncharacterized protein n=1 Tax=Ooceraea biroi TaxID=2015173 RepID=A0A026W5N4_OOCBI|nr:hypothetical protein X777_11155 [Ooceraea biroi]
MVSKMFAACLQAGNRFDQKPHQNHKWYRITKYGTKWKGYLGEVPNLGLANERDETWAVTTQGPSTKRCMQFAFTRVVPNAPALRLRRARKLADCAAGPRKSP